MRYVSPCAFKLLKRNAIAALPFTRPDSLTSVTVPLNSAPVGRTVVPDTRTGLASDALTGSSTLLVAEPSVLSTVISSAVPAGMVISRNLGAGGGGGAGGGALAACAGAGEAGAAAAGRGASAGAEVAGCAAAFAAGACVAGADSAGAAAAAGAADAAGEPVVPVASCPVAAD